jgi:FeS assembly protein IscX
MHWSDIEEIVEHLEDLYGDEEIPEYNLPVLKEMVYSIDEFDDHEVDVDEEVLRQIIEHWIEIRDQK